MRLAASSSLLTGTPVICESLRVVTFHSLLQIFDPDNMFGDVVFIYPAIFEQQVLDTVQQGEVCANLRS